MAAAQGLLERRSRSSYELLTIKEESQIQLYFATLEEGRSFLARQPATVKYDIIFVDCFTGSGQHPYSLSTIEFYELTRSHLVPGGVLATNIVASDPMFAQKWLTMQGTFAHVWHYETGAAHVFFGSDERLGLDQLRVHAERIFRRAPFSFPFVELLDDVYECPPAGRVNVLTDRERLAASADDLMFRDVGRNDPCGPNDL